MFQRTVHRTKFSFKGRTAIQIESRLFLDIVHNDESRRHVIVHSPFKVGFWPARKQDRYVRFRYVR